MEDIQIIREFKARLNEVLPEAEIYFYGSRVKRTHREDSDYDVLVLLDEVSPGVRKAVYDSAWEVGFQYDAVIAPVLSLKERFYSHAVSPFLDTVKSHGVVI